MKQDLSDETRKTFEYFSDCMGKFGKEMRTIELRLSKEETERLLDILCLATSLVRVKTIEAEIERRGACLRA